MKTTESLLRRENVYLVLEIYIYGVALWGVWTEQYYLIAYMVVLMALLKASDQLYKDIICEVHNDG